MNTTQNDHLPLHISAPPFVRDTTTVSGIMRDVLIALSMPFIASLVFFGIRSFFVVCICTAVAVATEMVINQLRKRTHTIFDGSALITGVLLAFTLPPTVSLFVAGLGAFFAIAVVKQTFGGLGNNFINPALAGRVFIMISYPQALSGFVAPFHGTIDGLDGTTGATPLMLLHTVMQRADFDPLLLGLANAMPHLLIGNVGGCIGQTSVVAIACGALYLWYKRVIGFAVPVGYIGTVFVCTWLTNGTNHYLTTEAIVVPLYAIMSGGLLLGSLFMATDPITSPVTARGRLLFGTGCGLLTFIFRRWGGSAEGVCYAILCMNVVTPLIDNALRPRRFGQLTSKKQL